MFKNHIKIAWRSLKKQPFFSFLNVFGLAIGISSGLLISLYIHDELSFDKMFADTERIHRVDLDVKFGGTESKMAVASAPMADALVTDFPQVELATRFSSGGNALIREKDENQNVKEPYVTFVDASFFEMFGLKLLLGDEATALTEPNTLILTKTAAEKHFGVNEALGQTMILNNVETYTVTGVIEDMPKNSFLRDYSVFMAMAGYEDALSPEWTSNNYPTFFKLAPGADVKNFQHQLQSLFGTYVIPYAQRFFPGISEEQFKAAGNHFYISSTPLTRIHLHSNLESEMSANSSIQNIYILSFIGLFLIVLASVNFMNLSTAYSLKRSKEVGVRKTLGSTKITLLWQFLMESGLITFISLVAALILAVALLPLFNGLAGKEISIPFTNPMFWIVLVVMTLLLGLFSGAYPAFFMSRFIPAVVLKGSGEKSVGGGKIRNVLVVFQFAISVFLIVSTIVVYQQLNFIQKKDLGFSKSQVLVIEDVFAAGDKARTFKEEVGRIGQVESVTLTGFLPTPSYRTNTTFFKEGSTHQENTINMQTWRIDHDYLSTLDMELISGRNFDRQFVSDSTAMLLNESAVAILGITPEEVLGMRLSRDLGEQDAEFFKVVGVVKDFHFESLKKGIGALSMTLGNSTGALAVKLESEDFSSSIAAIENIWRKVAPGQPFNYRFMDDAFNSTYEAEQKLGKIFMVFTILSILIACLGLFGLAAFNAEKRTKEIGVRKVLGASVSQITYRLTIDFLKLVGIAILISLPLGWYAMNTWLEDFSYRINIGIEILVLAALLAVTVAIITVSYQSIKAAIVNPVKSLKTE
ncbi:ABC transporter permease [Flagellimonas sp. HSM57]|uniref:ABC transporter permease n=1 Tax=Flagellimonas sp. HSM57 TaxID=2654675 RepID=UPI0013D3D912|nr:ABC transporter permease [Flagellimonas sp. HSM57]